MLAILKAKLQWLKRAIRTYKELEAFATRDRSSEESGSVLFLKDPRDMSTADLGRIIKPDFERWQAARQSGTEETA